MQKQKQKTIYCYRTVWHPQRSETLEAALRDCLQGLPNSADTQLDLGDRHAGIMHRKTSSPILLHIAYWTPEQQASTVPHVRHSPSNQLSSYPPGKDWDYLDADGVMLVSGDICLSIAHNVRIPRIADYIMMLLNRDKKGANANFRLGNAANQDVVKQVHKEGVQHIELNVSEHLGSIERWGEEESTIVQNIGRDVLDSLLGRDTDKKKKVAEATNVTAKLIIDVNSRKPGISVDDLVNTSTQIVQENPMDITITTAKKNKIKQAELVLSRAISVSFDNKAMHHQDAWEAMKEYLKELRESGNLEE